MAELDRIGRRIATAEDLQSVVRTMKTLSAVEIVQYQEAARAIEGYRATVEQAMQGTMVAHGPPPPGPARAPGAAALVAVGTDFGLCGAFNEDVVARAQQGMAELALTDPAPRVLVLGLRLEARWSAGIAPPEAAMALPSSLALLGAAVGRVLRRLEDWQRRHGVGRIFAVHQVEGEGPRFGRVAPVGRDDLARLAARRWPGPSLPMAADRVGVLMPALIRQAIFARLYGAAALSRAAEYAARLSAMRAAEQNIADKLDAMRIEYRLRRQDAITAELMDVVAGYEASRSDGLS